MLKYKLLISYDGTAYVGWQMQPNGSSIQETIQKALSLLLKEDVQLIGAGRTDAGVHALGQVAHFVTAKGFDLPHLLYRLNHILPHDIRILALSEVPASFHARYSAQKKEYHYHLCDQQTVAPFQRLYRTYVRQKLDPLLLQQALTYFLGEHDFCSFANVNHQVKSTVRTLYRADVIEEEGGYRIEFEGNGFLYKMVRNITGTVLSVAQGKLGLDTIPLLFDKKDRRAIGMTAHAQGLFLVKITY